MMGGRRGFRGARGAGFTQMYRRTADRRWRDDPAKPKPGEFYFVVTGVPYPEPSAV